MEQLAHADVPGMLVVTLDVDPAGPHALWAREPLRVSDVEIVSEYIGAADSRQGPLGWEWKCPRCGGWEFGPTMPIEAAVRTWLHGGRLPRAALLAGACLYCEHATQPSGLDVVDPDDVAAYLKRRQARGES